MPYMPVFTVFLRFLNNREITKKAEYSTFQITRNNQSIIKIEKLSIRGIGDKRIYVIVIMRTYCCKKRVLSCLLGKDYL